MGRPEVQGQKQMSVFSDRFVRLTDANEKPEANGRTLCIAKSAITAFFRLEKDPSKTLVLTADGLSYTVKESVQEVYKMVD